MNGIEYSELKIEKAVAEDIDEIVRLQSLSQPSFFAVRLGCHYLLHHYWPVIFSMPESCVVFVARGESEIKGFVVFTTQIAELKQALTSRKWHALPHLIKLAIRSPRDIYGILALSKSKEIRMPAEQVNHQPVELFTIAVDPSATGQKLGTKLIERGFSEYPGYSIVVWAEEANIVAIEFYKKSGFTPVKRERFGRLNLILLSRDAIDSSPR